VIDEVGYTRLTQAQAQALFELITRVLQICANRLTGV
jgi:DNA replication protein DnaC